MPAFRSNFATTNAWSDFWCWWSHISSGIILAVIPCQSQRWAAWILVLLPWESAASNSHRQKSYKRRELKVLLRRSNDDCKDVSIARYLFLQPKNVADFLSLKWRHGGENIATDFTTKKTIGKYAPKNNRGGWGQLESKLCMHKYHHWILWCILRTYWE